jgi:hypothetical protein
MIFSVLYFNDTYIYFTIFKIDNNNLSLYEFKEYKLSDIDKILNNIIKYKNIKILTNINYKNEYYKTLTSFFNSNKLVFSTIKIQNDIDDLSNCYRFFEYITTLNIKKNCQNTFENTLEYLLENNSNTIDTGKGLFLLLLYIPKLIKSHYNPSKYIPNNHYENLEETIKKDREKHNKNPFLQYQTNNRRENFNYEY